MIPCAVQLESEYSPEMRKWTERYLAQTEILNVRSPFRTSVPRNNKVVLSFCRFFLDVNLLPPF